MINHFYTLLCNLDGQGFAAGEGEEYTPPEYRAVTLPGPLAKVRQALFGTDPDRRAITYRARQVLAAVHATPLAGFAVDQDPRVTYLPLPRGGFELSPSLSVTPIGGHPYALHAAGDQPAQAAGGRLSRSWTISTR